MAGPVWFARGLSALAIGVAGFAGGGPLAAQSVFEVSSTSALTGDPITLEVTLDHAGSGLSGWSLGICTDPTELVLTGVGEGPVLMTAQNGLPPDFHLLQTYEGGFTSGVVVCFVGCALLPPGVDQLVYEPSYAVVGLAPVISDVTVCSSLGDPPVSVLVLLDNGDPATPGTVSGSVEIPGPLPLRFELGLGATATLYDPDDGLSAPSLGASILELPTSAGAPNPVSGFTLPVGHDPFYLTPVGAVPGPDLAQAGGGLGPETFLVELHPEGLIVEATVGVTDPWLTTIAQAAVTLNYASVPSSLQFNFFGATTSLFVDGAASDPSTPPTVQSTVNLPVGITSVEGMITFIPRQSFRRGDANDDGALDIADPLAILGYLFTGGSLSCLEAADGNGDAQVDIGDVIALLGFLFAGAPGPPPPHPTCGFDPDAALGCAFHGACP